MSTHYGMSRTHGVWVEEPERQEVGSNGKQCITCGREECDSGSTQGVDYKVGDSV